MKKWQLSILKEQDTLYETKTNNQVFSEALISLDLEVDDALYLEHSSGNEYTHRKISDRKSKTVQQKNSVDETIVRMTSFRSFRTTRKLPEIEGNAKFLHIEVQTGLKH